MGNLHDDATHATSETHSCAPHTRKTDEHTALQRMGNVENGRPEHKMCFAPSGSARASV
eukprot:CAMPEP_0203962028 /NCGR_PEP_ID=MMETSP0359-20131031/92327_1 /ASSEMBLY_ACC=CAM_ASM_000338 /TAXON_ID=268821 /ORGANISM="Scrippsiella Hangoei, Strain SHTV-5" /LENGTH=58 /DNA_ID=CAMNT_0050897153 /DNA_START=57 /DNA_END=230 /DNA_ORIENTATION=-